MKTVLAITAVAFAFAAPAFAEGDAEAGKKGFKRCKACHKIVSPEGETIFKGGKTGPNLYGVVGRVAGSSDFKYSKTLVKAGEEGLVWSEDTIAAFATDPKAFLKETVGETKTKMSFKMKKGANDVAAYLASVAPAPAAAEEPAKSE